MGAPDITPPAGGGGGGGGITGSGTAGYVAKFTGTGTSIGDSLVRDNGTDVSIDMAPVGGYKLSINGNATIVGNIDALTGSINTLTSRPSQNLVLQRDGVTAATIAAGGVVSFAGVVKTPDGTTSAPSYAFSSSAATGFSYGTSGNLLRASAGAGGFAFGVSSAGNINIGGLAATAGSTKLDVFYGDYQTIGAIRIGADLGTVSTRTDATAKLGAISIPHYTNAQANILFAGTHSLSGSTLMYIGGGLGSMNAATSIQFYTGATNTTAAGNRIATINQTGVVLDSGTSTLIVNASTSGQGIKLPTAPANGDANTLDCYEEGTWTPVDRSGASLSFTAVAGTYTRVGRTVIAQCTLTYPSTANASDASFSLPVAMTSANTNFGGATIGSVGTLVKNNVSALIKTGATPATDSRIALITYNGAGTVTNANMSLVTIVVSVMYNVA